MPRGRPTGARREQNRLKRLRAFEFYAGGQTKTEIANTLGVTKAAVGGWAKQDQWDGRLAAIASRASESVDFTVGETIADISAKIRGKYTQRLKELDALCTSSLSTPQVKISAIKAWFELGQKVTPDPFKQANDPRNLELIQDLLPQESPAVREPRQPTPSCPSTTDEDSSSSSGSSHCGDTAPSSPRVA